jgi:hypothetical protein
MATARVYPDTVQLISIDITGEATSPGITMANSDTVSFYNGAPFPVAIQFICENGPVFNNIPNIAHSATSASQSAQKVQITTDYFVVNLNTNVKAGPYSIEVGINTQTVPAPLLIPIVGGAPVPNQKTVSVPLNGWIEFSLDQQYTIGWTPASAFPPITSPVGPGKAGPYQAATGNQAGSSVFSLASTQGITGNGTVKIRS